MQLRLLAFVAVVAFIGVVAPAQARVVSYEVTSRTDVLAGAPFGATGAYEKIVGKLHYADDPTTAANMRVVDIGLAPRNAKGEVESVGDFYLLRPKDEAKGNGAVIVEVNNRGGKGLIWHANEAKPAADPTTAAEFGDGFLMKHGFTVMWVGWQTDVPRAPATNMKLTAPVAKNADGSTITGLVRADFHVDAPAPEQGIGHNDSVPYPVADENDPANVLTEREDVVAPRATIPRTLWHFTNNGTSIALTNGFVPGKIYELVYKAKDPTVIGLGMTAERDAVAWVKHDPQALAHAKFAYGYGISQTGRYLRQFLEEDFNADEEGRLVFDGVMPIVSGASLGSFNYRFGQASRDAAAFSSFFYPTDRPPFTDAAETDPIAGTTDGILTHAGAAATPVKIMYLFTSHEYYARVASLMTTNVEGTADVALPDAVRAYACMGGEHVPRVSAAPRKGARYTVDPLDYTWPERALILRLDAWVRNGTAPPESRYPHIADGTLVNPEKLHFPAIPGVRPPTAAVVHRTWRYDFGPAWSRGIASLQPPTLGRPYPVLVPQIDADGNDTGGLRLPEIAVPLATYTGWNIRTPETGFGEQLYDFFGSYLPFARTAAQRAATGDPRPAIGERYASEAAYLARYDAATQALVRDGYVLAGDAAALHARAERFWRAASAPPSP
jgi:hypothetical protein